MTAFEIMQAVDNNRTVYWCNNHYRVFRDVCGEYLIFCNLNNDTIGLTWKDGKTLNGKEEDFYIERTQQINNLADVQNLFRDICELGVKFHDDDDLADYIPLKDDTLELPRKEALRLNTLLNEASVLCDTYGVDIYELANAIQQECEKAKV